MCNVASLPAPSASTANPAAPGFDAARSEAFVGKLVGILSGGALSLMISLGHRAGLFDALAAAPHGASPQALAAAAGANERYVREWLGAMLAGGLVELDPASGRYRLPPEHAAWLTRAAAPNNFAVPMQFVAVLGGVEDEVLAAFRHGQGVPYASYRRFHEVMAEESAQSVVAGLEEHILPLAPGLRERLQQGIRVVDIGCGAGRAVARLAQLFPRSDFTGIDFCDDALALARADAARRALPNLRFHAADAAAWNEPAAYDLVTTFDAVHDQRRPDLVLANIRRALRPGGLYLMQDIKACSHHAGNTDNPLAPFIYTISCMHCMSVALQHGGMGLGAAWGRELAEQMLAAAGFDEVTVRELPHDPMNYWYLCPA